MVVPSKRANLRTQNLLLSLALIPSSEAAISNKSNKRINKRRKNGNGMFECKTCSREFSSFQALGGHSTSHLRPKLRFNGIDLEIKEKYNKDTMKHVCGICGKEFATGMALGGHMRLHRENRSYYLPEQEDGLGFMNLLERIGSDDHGDVGSDYDDDDEGSPGRLLNLFE